MWSDVRELGPDLRIEFTHHPRPVETCGAEECSRVTTAGSAAGGAGPHLNSGPQYTGLLLFVKSEMPGIAEKVSLAQLLSEWRSAVHSNGRLTAALQAGRLLRFMGTLEPR